MLTERGDAEAEKSPLIEAFMIEFGIMTKRFCFSCSFCSRFWQNERITKQMSNEINA
jgi:hypothetical protein